LVWPGVNSTFRLAFAYLKDIAFIEGLEVKIHIGTFVHEYRSTSHLRKFPRTREVISMYVSIDDMCNLCKLG
jgi:hypothetical protein